MPRTVTRFWLPSMRPNADESGTTHLVWGQVLDGINAQPKFSKDNEAAQQRIGDYGKARYKKYHGSEDGWQELLAAAILAVSVPKSFS